MKEEEEEGRAWRVVIRCGWKALVVVERLLSLGTMGTGRGVAEEGREARLKAVHDRPCWSTMARVVRRKASTFLLYVVVAIARIFIDVFVLLIISYCIKSLF